MKDWIKFIAVAIGWIVMVVTASFLLNFTGDCGPEVANCGEASRRISFVVLAFGLIGLGYYVCLFIRQQRRH